MVRAIRVHEYGGPEVLRWDEVELGDPLHGEVQMRQTAVGLNYIDVYSRSGLYKQDSLPFVIGMEGAGEVVAVGEGVSDLAPGDRVAYAGPIGSYAEVRNISAQRLIKVPDSVDDKTAAGMMLQGMTARYLLRATYNVGPDTTILFHAAAGGVGLIACQWANYLGATVIGTVGSAEKAELARNHGCHHTINYTQENFVDKVTEITNGPGVDVVYDAVGATTFPGSLDCLKQRGLWASFGQSSGPVPDFSIGLLEQKGSLYATRPSLFAYTAKREDLVETANDLFAVVGGGHVKIPINQPYALQVAKQAHLDLEARKTTGSTVLLPDA